MESGIAVIVGEVEARHGEGKSVVGLGFRSPWRRCGEIF